MSVPAPDETSLEDELRGVSFTLAENERVRDELLRRRNELCRVLVCERDRKIGEVARMAGISPSAVAFALGKYQRSGRRKGTSG